LLTLPPPARRAVGQCGQGGRAQGLGLGRGDARGLGRRGGLGVHGVDSGKFGIGFWCGGGGCVGVHGDDSGKCRIGTAATASCTPWLAQCCGSPGRKQLTSRNTIRLAWRGAAGAGSRPRAVLSRDHRGLLIGHRDWLAGIPSECDPALSIRSTIWMLPSGWITRWRNQGLCRQIIPCNRRQDFCCAGKIDWSFHIAIIRDAMIIILKATCGATEMVIAVRP